MKMGRNKKDDSGGCAILFILGLFIFLIVSVGWWTLAILVPVGFLFFIIYNAGQKKENPSITKDAPLDYPSYGYSTSSKGRLEDDAKWIPKGTEINIQGYKITGGMLYIGKSLEAISRGFTDHCLINPSLRINRNNPDTEGTTMTYWPSYTQISPEARAAFLEWLSTGRENPKTYIGYVFLFFYGLERHVYEAKCNNSIETEFPPIATEVQRLLTIYGDSNRSFHTYGTSLLDFISSYFQDSRLDLLPIDYVASHVALPFPLKRELGKLSADSKPIPASLAFAWFIRSPGIVLRTPGIRCSTEFTELFKARYIAKYGDGLIIKPKKTELCCHHYQASASLSMINFSHVIEGIPDVTVQSTEFSKLEAIANVCMNDLDLYSRYLGKNPENQDRKVFGLAYLPREILSQRIYPEIQQLQIFLDSITDQESFQYVDISNLMFLLGLPPNQDLNDRESLLVAQLLGSLGYGIEPDIRFGNSKMIHSEGAIIFNLKGNQASTASREYTFAALLISFSSLVIHADDKIELAEEKKMRAHIASILSLTSNEKRRLEALIRYYSIKPATFKSAKQRAQNLNPESKNFILNFLLQLANADGNIAPGEIGILKKIYELFGKDGNDVYSDIHAIQTTCDEPITIKTNEPTSKKFVIPKDTNETQKGTKVTLNMELVSRTIRETQQVQTLLINIFAEQDELAKEPPLSKEQVGKRIADLDDSHSQLVLRISEMETISCDDFNEICKQLGILPDGATEILNSAFYEKVNGLFIEENDGLLFLDQEVLKEILV